MSTTEFFDFARERHAVYLRRQAGQSAPWTTDPVLDHYRFTNVFRELDRTTVWFRENVRDPMRDRPEVLLATVLFRWFNRISTGEAMFTQSMFDADTMCVPAWDVVENMGVRGLATVKASILSYCGRGPYVTGAYIIKTPDGMSKLDGVLDCVEKFMRQKHVVPGFEPLGEIGWHELAEVLLADCTWDDPGARAATLEGAWAWLRQFPYLGDFMAYEIVTDLRHTALLDRAPDIMTWANPGPGAARGLGRVVHDDPSVFDQRRDKAGLIDSMRELLEYSRDAGFWPQQTPASSTEENFDWKYTRNCDYDLTFQRPGSWPAWEMRDVEHTLCEFDKHERARLGEGRPRGVFRHG